MESPQPHLSVILVLALSGAVLPAPSTHSAEPHSEHTFKLSEGETRPRATLEDASWLVGSWSGRAFGKQFEEVWNAPSAGSMVGMFKVFDASAVEFYEIMLLTREEGTLSLKVKHFSADFVAWEDKPDFVNFRLVKVEDDALHFGGISFYRRDSNNVDAYIVLTDEGETKEHKLVYRRE